jgi:hypothetical protein
MRRIATLSLFLTLNFILVAMPLVRPGQLRQTFEL